MVRRSTYKKKYYKPAAKRVVTMTKVGGKKLGRPVGSKNRKSAPRRTVRAPVRRKVAGRKPKCRVHRVCISTKGGKKIRAVMNCKGKIRMTKGGRKTFNVMKRRCKCKKNTGLRGKPVGKYGCAVKRRAHRK
jgi:hypothetical protein